MCGILVAALLATLPAQALIRADLVPAPDAAATAPERLHLDLPALSLGDARGALFAGSGAGAGRVEPAVALILGIFPGFGLGHYVAGSAQWTNWLLIDAVLLAALILVSAIDVGPLVALGWVATLVERVVEGIDAYHRAGGPRIASGAPAGWGALARGPGAAEVGRERALASPQVVLAVF